MSRMRNPGRWLSYAAGIALAAATAACGSAPDDPASAVHSAADATAQAGTARLDTTMTMTSAGRTQIMHGQGTFDFRSGSGQLSLQVPTTPGTTDNLNELLTPDALYLSGPTIGVPSGKWARMSVSQLIDGDLISSGTTNPATSLEMMRAARDVQEVGTATVQGTAVRHYHGTVNLATAGLTGADTPGGAPASGGITQPLVPFDAYLDDQHRLRQVDETFTLNVPVRGAAPQPVTVVSSTQYHDFGVPVQLSFPPAADIVDVATGTTRPGPTPAPSATLARAPHAGGAPHPAVTATSHRPTVRATAAHQ